MKAYRMTKEIKWDCNNDFSLPQEVYIPIHVKDIKKYIEEKFNCRVVSYRLNNLIITAQRYN